MIRLLDVKFCLLNAIYVQQPSEGTEAARVDQPMAREEAVAQPQPASTSATAETAQSAPQIVKLELQSRSEAQPLAPAQAPSQTAAQAQTGAQTQTIAQAQPTASAAFQPANLPKLPDESSFSFPANATVRSVAGSQYTYVSALDYKQHGRVVHFALYEKVQFTSRSAHRPISSARIGAIAVKLRAQVRGGVERSVPDVSLVLVFGDPLDARVHKPTEVVPSDEQSEISEEEKSSIARTAGEWVHKHHVQIAAERAQRRAEMETLIAAEHEQQSQPRSSASAPSTATPSAIARAVKKEISPVLQKVKEFLSQASAGSFTPASATAASPPSAAASCSPSAVGLLPAPSAPPLLLTAPSAMASLSAMAHQQLGLPSALSSSPFAAAALLQRQLTVFQESLLLAAALSPASVQQQLAFSLQPQPHALLSSSAAHPGTQQTETEREQSGEPRRKRQRSGR